MFVFLECYSTKLRIARPPFLFLGQNRPGLPRHSFRTEWASRPISFTPNLKTVPSIRRLRFVRNFFLGKNEGIIVNNDIKVTVIGIDGDDVTLAIDIPEWMEIGEIESLQDMELASTG